MSRHVIASETTDCLTTANNIGVIFNNSLSMLQHVTAVCKSSFFHLQNISKVRKFLSLWSFLFLMLYTFSRHASPRKLAVKRIWYLTAVPGTGWHQSCLGVTDMDGKQISGRLNINGHQEP